MGSCLRRGERIGEARVGPAAGGRRRPLDAPAVEPPAGASPPCRPEPRPEADPCGVRRNPQHAEAGRQAPVEAEVARFGGREAYLAPAVARVEVEGERGVGQAGAGLDGLTRSDQRELPACFQAGRASASWGTLRCAPQAPSASRLVPCAADTASDAPARRGSRSAASANRKRVARSSTKRLARRRSSSIQSSAIPSGRSISDNQAVRPRSLRVGYRARPWTGRRGRQGRPVPRAGCRAGLGRG